MTTYYQVRSSPPPRYAYRAAQAQARRVGLRVLRAGYFREYAGTDAERAGHVVVTDFGVTRLAGPFSVEEAAAWLAAEKLRRLHRSAQ
jgi:hypothetical protein